MTTGSHLGEQSGFAGTPPAVAAMLAVPPNTRGLRRQTLETFAVQGEAEGFSGLSEDIPHYRRVLDIAAKALRLQGVSESALALLGYLFDWTRPQDWTAGSRPIVYPSNDTVCADHCVTEASLRRHVMELRQAGAIAMKDSGNHKRHGRRDSEGRLILSGTFGYDLSPLALRLAQYQDLAEAHKAGCDLRKEARRNAKIASRALQQLIESAAEWQLLSSYWEGLPQRLAELQMKRAASTAALTDLAYRLEQLRKEALTAFNVAIAERAEGAKSRAPETCGTNGENAAAAGNNKDDVSGRPLKSERHYNTTKTPLIENLVQAQHEKVVGCSGTSPPVGSTPGAAEAVQQPNNVKPAADFEETDRWSGRTPWQGGELNSQTVETSPQELAALVPEIGDRMAAAGQPPTWGGFTTATAGYAAAYGINRAMIRKAERLIGWQSAHIALAVVASKALGNFDVSPGAYYNGMLKKAASGELDLRRSLWGLRQLHAGVPAPSAAVRKTAQAAKTAAKEASKELDKTAAAPPLQPQPVRLTDAEEDRADRRKAASMPRLGNATQSLGAALAGMVAAAPVKRALAPVLTEPRLSAAPTESAVAAPGPATPDAVTAKIMADLAASRARAGEAEAARLAAMTPQQRAQYDEKERIRRQVCSQHRRKDGQRF
jgi:replication initiation protein RepC